MGTRIGEKPSVYNSDYVPTHNKAVLGTQDRSTQVETIRKYEH